VLKKLVLASLLSLMGMAAAQANCVGPDTMATAATVGMGRMMIALSDDGGNAPAGLNDANGGGATAADPPAPDPVPEPHGFVLVLAGLGVLTLAVRRQMRR
jgi:hypothetical protein